MTVIDIHAPDFQALASRMIVGVLSDMMNEDNTNVSGVEDELRALFEQGYYLGLNKGWAIEQDKERSDD